MQYREIGKTGVKVSEISLGCWTMGGLNWVDGKANGWANVDENEITKAIRTGIEAGINHFDNADVYGNGRAERILARALKKLGVNSNDFIIATKVGHFKGTAEHAYDPLHIRHQCEQSLKNLNRDYIDIYYLHHGDFGEKDEWLDSAAETLNRLIEEGKIRLKGQSAYSEKDFLKSVKKVNPSVLQSWANILRPEFIKPEGDIGKLLAERDISFIAFSPLQQGLLLDKFDPYNPPIFEEGDFRATNERFSIETLKQLKPRLEDLKQRFGAGMEILSAVAQRYILNHPHVACVIPGFRNEMQVSCNLSASGFTLTGEDMSFIENTFSSVKF